MSFKDLIKQIAERIEKLRTNLLKEETTKNALICRLCLNSLESKYIVVNYLGKDWEKRKISSIDDIYKYSDELIKSASQYI